MQCKNPSDVILHHGPIPQQRQQQQQQRKQHLSSSPTENECEEKKRKIKKISTAINLHKNHQIDHLDTFQM